MRRLFGRGIVAGLLIGCSSGSDQPPVTHRFFTLPSGDSLHYTVAGTGGDTIVVLAGGPGWSSSYMREPLRGLEGEHVLLFPNLRGRGRSSPISDSTAISLERDLSDLRDFQAGLKLERPVLVGHGYGAGLAAMYALRHPAQVSRLLLLSPMFTHVNLVWQASFQPNDSVATARYLVARRLGRDTVDAVRFCHTFWGFELSPVEETDSLVVKRVADGICDATPQNLRMTQVLNRGIRRSLGSWDWRDSLRRVMHPALIVQGGGNLFLQRTGQIWSELLPHSTFKPIDGDPHFPWLNNSSEFVNVVDDFLSPRFTARTQ